MKKFLIKLVIESDTKLGRRFDIFIQILIVLSLISFSVETIPDLDLRIILFLEDFELFTVIIFSIELLLRLILTKPPFKYIISFFGIVDFLAVLPFYLSTCVDLRSIRIFILFRLFRIFKLLKYNSAIDRLLFAFREIKKELFIFLIATIFLLYVSSVGIYYFEMLSLELLSTKLILAQFYLNILAVITIYGMQSLQNINLLRTKAK